MDATQTNTALFHTISDETLAIVLETAENGYMDAIAAHDDAQCKSWYRTMKMCIEILAVRNAAKGGV